MDKLFKGIFILCLSVVLVNCYDDNLSNKTAIHASELNTRLNLKGTIVINETEVEFLAYQYYSRKGLIPGLGPERKTPEALIRVGDDYELLTYQDTFSVNDRCFVLDTVHLAKDNIFLSISATEIIAETKSRENQVTLVDIGDEEVLHLDDMKISYHLIESPEKSPYNYNVVYFSDSCGKDTVETFVSDADMSICGHTHSLLWSFSGYTSFVTYENRPEIKKRFNAVSLYVY